MAIRVLYAGARSAHLFLGIRMKNYITFCITSFIVFGVVACSKQDAPANTQANKATKQAAKKKKSQAQTVANLNPLSEECKDSIESVCGAEVKQPLKCIKNNKDKVSNECRNEMMAHVASQRQAAKQKKQS